MRVSRATGRFTLATTAAVLVAVYVTWPMAAHLGTQVYDPAGTPVALSWALRADVYLTLWIPAWDVHALATAPWSLFDANIFYPSPCTLALSEHLLGLLPLYGPLMLLTGDPVLAHQGTLVVSFALAFLFMVVLVSDWTRSWPAAILAGALYAFSSHRMYGLSTIQVESDFYLPLIPLCLHEALRTGSHRWGIPLALVLVLQSLASLYLAYAAFMAVGLLLVGGIAIDRGARRGVLLVVVWVTVAAVVVAASAVPYLKGRAAGVIAPSTKEWLAFSSAPLGETGANLAAVLGLGTVAFWRRGVRQDIGIHWILGLLLLAVVGHALAVGPEVSVGRYRIPGPYALMTDLLPGFAAVRNPGRFNALAAVGFASLAGIGVAGLLHRLRSTSFRLPALVGVLACAVVVIERAGARSTPLMPIETRETVPPVYRWLERTPSGPVLEIPFWDFNFFPFQREIEARRVYRSVYHWHPLLNGYSGYTPPTYAAVSALVGALPDPRAVGLLTRTTGLKYIVMHRDELSKAQRRRWRSSSAQFRAVAVFGSDVIYVVRNPPAADLLARFVDSDPSPVSLLDTPLRELQPDGRRAQLTFASPAPTSVYRGLAFDVEVLVRNVSSARWPALTVGGDHVVTFAYRWLDDAGRPLTTDIISNRIPFDLAPGESVRVPVSVVASGFTGPSKLVIGLQQRGTSLEGQLEPVSIVVVSAG